MHDVIVIGGGPAGMTAALYTSRSKLKTLVIDKSVTSGALGITSKIANYPGIEEELSGEDLVMRMRRHAEKFGTEVLKARVVGVTVDDEVKTATTADGQTLEARALILATGAMGRASVLPGEEKLLGRGVSYCATCDGAFFKNKDVALLGHSDEAADEAIFLTRFVRSLAVITPKPKLEAGPELVEELTAKPGVSLLTGTRVNAILGEQSVTAVKLSNGKDLPVSGVFIFTQGSKPIVDYLQGQVQTSDQGCITVSRRMETPIPGVFACGDVLCNDVQQAVVAAAQGCIAALACDRYLNKRKDLAKDYR